MKLSNTDLFDVAQISDTKSYEELKEFIEYVNNFNRDIVKSYGNSITLEDNVTTNIRTLSVYHGTPIVLPSVTRFNVLSITSRTPIRSYYTFRNAQNALVLTVYFDQAIQVLSKEATWLRGQLVRYTALSTDNIKTGDFVTFSGFGTASNNGTYQVLKVEPGYLYCLNTERDDATDDESKTGYVGNTLTKTDIGITFIT